MPAKYYTLFGVKDYQFGFTLRVENPTALDKTAQIRAYDGGVNPLLLTYGAVESICDITWFLKASKVLYSLALAKPNTIAIIRSRQLRAVLSGDNYLGNYIYFCALNGMPLIYTDHDKHNSHASGYGFYDDVSNSTDQNVVKADFIHYNNPSTFDPALMTKIFLQGIYNNNYVATTVRGWVDDGHIFVMPFTQNVNYTTGMTTVAVLATVSLVAGDKCRIKVDEIGLRPLQDGQEYTLTNNAPASVYYFSTLPANAGWTVRTLACYVKGATEYPFLVECKHDASGGILLIWSGKGDSANHLVLPAYWYPILMYQYPLVKAGYLGAIPAYNTED